MKTLLRNSLLILLFIVTISSLKAQNILVANSNPGATGGTNVYTGPLALFDAVNASVNGDIIHVIPSAVSYWGGGYVYNDITIATSISIYGIGTNPDKEGSKRSSVGGIIISADNVVISGLYLEEWVSLNNVNGILIENCYLSYGIDNNGTNTGNITIRSNIIGAYQSASRIRFDLNTSSNVSITNNIILIPNSVSTYEGIEANGGPVITNNIFVSNGTGNAYAFINIDAGVIKNNVFYGVNPFGLNSTTNCTFKNNLTYGNVNNSIPIGVNGNEGDTVYVNQDPLFVDLPLVTSWNFSYDPKPDVGSPLLINGDDGLDIGITGGTIPYNFEGTNLPLIQSVNIPSVIIQGNTLPTTIKAKGN